MGVCISVVNSGSSSIKFSLFNNVETEELQLVFGGQVEGIGVAPRFTARNVRGDVLEEKSWENRPEIDHEYLMGFIFRWIRENRQRMDLELLGVGHRVVHGGPDYSSPVRVDDAVLRNLEKYIALAPLHQPHNLGPIRSIMNLGADIPQVACFDTAFHRTNPPVAQQFALPYRFADDGIRRYGFHGLSYEYISHKLQVLDPRVAAGRVVAAHLGSGASMCALKGGKSIASSMGFSAMDGIPMGTRPGNLDPGVVLYLMQEMGMSPDELEDLFYKRSGLLGISGISNDMRILLESEDPRAEDAIGVFAYRVQRELGSLTAALGGLDALVFTAGVGENSPAIRARVCEGAHWLGLRLDLEANQQGQLNISTPDSPVSAWVIPTNEELMIATHTRNILLGAQE
jgi:acetate kinase